MATRKVISYKTYTEDIERLQLSVEKIRKEFDSCKQKQEELKKENNAIIKQNTRLKLWLVVMCLYGILGWSVVVFS